MLLTTANLGVCVPTEVVEDARQNFNASTSAAPLPPLPVAPAARSKSKSNSNELSRSQRSNRVPRKILAANQIFVNEYESGSAGLSPLTSSFDHSNITSLQTSFAASQRENSLMNDDTLPTIPSEDERSRVEPVMFTPNKNRARRATVVTRSPEPKQVKVGERERPSLEIDTELATSSPNKRREKSRSQNDLGRAITPVTQLEFEIERRE